ncbi:sensor histidine kinase [Diplocloster modestus]|uniref:Sensor histidine kinase n=1 Tax=Diplocloster modestus TaxID=2850322 RepID=A0ABS6K6Q2_9FIRM|nr:sensor histidine kinase [Diplocloster modestus]MBU9726209.1 sensor histidine kinase [Diplocloster modestus]
MWAGRVKEKLRHPGIFLKILVLFECILILVVIVTSSYIIERFSKTVIEKEIMLGDTKLDRLADYCNDKYNRVYSLYNYIHSGPIAEIAAKAVQNPDDGYQINNIEITGVFSKGVISADPDISDVIISAVNGIVYSFSGDGYVAVKPSFDFMHYPAMEEFLDSEDTICMYYDDPTGYTLKEREPVLSFAGKIFDPTIFPKRELVGIFIMNVPLKAIEKQDPSLNTSMDGELTLLNSHDQILYSTNHGRWGKTAQAMSHDDTEEYIKSKEVGTSGMKAIYTLSNQDLIREIQQMKSQIYKVMAAAIIFTMTVCLVIYRVFNRQVQTLIHSMKKLQTGDFNLHIPVKSKDEIGIISQAFNEMCSKLDNYISEVYAAEIQRKNAELNALQTQIDPHFLYNTLDSIRARALAEQDENTGEMIVLLGKLFRWSSRTTDKFITLEDELEYIDTYLKLQKYRYEDRLDVDIRVPEDYLDDMIPKLILQPLVENVIKHALSDKEGTGLIGIVAKEKEGKRLEITIFDNGKGIEDQVLREMYEKLNQQVAQDEFKSIGLQNVQARLKLLFGGEYGLMIRSIAGVGTAVKVIIPILTKKDVQEDVSITYRG